MQENKTFLHVFDQHTLRNIVKLTSDGLITELIGPIGTGKESYVFYSKDVHGDEVAVKIHRHNIQSFKEIPSYLSLRGIKSGGFLNTIDDWTRYEYKSLERAFNSGVRAPKPIGLYKNLIVMGFVGFNGVPAASAIKDSNFDLEEWYKDIIGFIIKMGKSGMIHGDLSPYNILNFDSKPYLIDFSQSLKLTSLTKEYLTRDINNINNWFLKLRKQDLLTEQEVLDSIYGEKK